jgi:hypothetical protein
MSRLTRMAPYLDPVAPIPALITVNLALGKVVFHQSSMTWW